MLKNKSKNSKIVSLEKLKNKLFQLSNQSIELFISYSSFDKEIAQKIAKNLKRHGYNVWLDEWKIKVGDSIIDKIGKGIIESDFLLILLSKKSTASQWVKQELNVAKMKEINKNKVFILPILIEDCAVPSMISDKKYADIRKSYRKGINEILKVLKEAKSEP
jgi:predicted nucleotide-binding protein